MTALGWFSAGFGVCLGMTIAVATIVDVIFVQMKTATISARTLAVSREYPVVAALIAAILGLIIGTLIGHLWFPQYVNGP